MSLADDLEAADIPNGGKTLRVDEILATLDDKDRETLLTALQRSTLTGAQIARALRARGERCSDAAVHKWRARDQGRA